MSTAKESIHKRIEEIFRSLGHGIYARPWTVLGLTFLITAVLIAFLPSIRTDFSNDSYLLPGDDARQHFDAFRDQFGLDPRRLVMLIHKEQLTGAVGDGPYDMALLSQYDGGGSTLDVVPNDGSVEVDPNGFDKEYDDPPGDTFGDFFP